MKYTITFILIVTMLSCISSKKSARGDFYFKEKHGIYVLKENKALLRVRNRATRKREKMATDEAEKN